MVAPRERSSPSLPHPSSALPINGLSAIDYRVEYGQVGCQKCPLCVAKWQSIGVSDVVSSRLICAESPFITVAGVAGAHALAATSPDGTLFAAIIEEIVVCFAFEAHMPWIQDRIERGPWTTQDLHSSNLSSSGNNKRRKGRSCYDESGENAAALSKNRRHRAASIPGRPILLENWRHARIHARRHRVKRCPTPIRHPRQYELWQWTYLHDAVPV